MRSCDHRYGDIPESDYCLKCGALRETMAPVWRVFSKPSEHPVAAICGGHPIAQPIPADLMGCGKEILTCAEVFRCWDCGTAYHRECGKKSPCATDGILTDAMVDEIERRAKEKVK